MQQDYEQFLSSFRAGLFFALKANSTGVARLFRDLGSGFEVGSEGTLRLLLELGVPASKIISGNTSRHRSSSSDAYSYGVRKFTFDSYAEIGKMALLANSQVYVRIAVPNNYSEWPLDRKFGIERREGDRPAGHGPRGRVAAGRHRFSSRVAVHQYRWLDRRPGPVQQGVSAARQ